jgi:hypothetical protein
MLKIEILSERKVSSLTNEFNELFPHLLLKLYYKAAAKSDHSKHAHLHREHFAEKPRDILSDCQEKKVEGTLEFHAEMSVQKFKSLLENDFGIHTEIYHQSGKHQWSTLPVPSENPLFESNFETH